MPIERDCVTCRNTGIVLVSPNGSPVYCHCIIGRREQQKNSGQVPATPSKTTTCNTNLSRDDWKWVLQAAQQRWQRADPKPGEPPASADYKAEKKRIFAALYALAFKE